jgi:hypothetical protein
MKNFQILGFLVLLVSTIGLFQSSVYALETNDDDGDGIPNNVDQCPSQKEDYNPEYGYNIDGCPADFVPWYDADYDGIEDHVDDCPTVRENYNRFEDDDGCPDSFSESSTTIKDSDGDGIFDYSDFCPTQPEKCPKTIIDSKMMMVVLILYLKMKNHTHSQTLMAMGFKIDGMHALMSQRISMEFLIKMDAPNFQLVHLGSNG